MTPREVFRAQARACTALGSPFMGRLMTLCAERLSGDTAVGARLLNWPGDPGISADSISLRLAGALHALKLEGLALEAVYPPHDAQDDALWTAVEDALVTHEARLLDWLTRAPQTNEIRRSAVLIAGLAEIAKRYPDQEVALLELGASAGLNLQCDAYRLDLPGRSLGPDRAEVVLTPDWKGPLPPAQLPKVASRTGVDLAPIDPADPDARLRLLSYLWPDQPHRRSLTEAGFAQAARRPVRIAKGDAGDWLAAALSARATDHLRVVMHSVAWQYFLPATAETARRAMAHAATPLVELAMEADGGKGTAVTLTHWPEGRTEPLGRADFHGRWIAWD
ncbi:MAG: DUF2332 family protein [Silicimonas sp.]|nr:DUF2332 family protein [Silicimonas sp.]